MNMERQTTGMPYLLNDINTKNNTEQGTKIQQTTMKQNKKTSAI